MESGKENSKKAKTSRKKMMIEVAILVLLLIGIGVYFSVGKFSASTLKRSRSVVSRTTTSTGSTASQTASQTAATAAALAKTPVLGPSTLGLYRSIGDANGDGHFNALDTDLMNKMLNSTVPKPSNLCMIDANMDGVFDKTDIDLVGRMLDGKRTLSSPGKCVVQMIGDLNGNGVIDSSTDPDNKTADNVLVLRIVTGIDPVPADICVADANQSGAVDPGDASVILNITSGARKDLPGVCASFKKAGDINGDGKIDKDSDVKATLEKFLSKDKDQMTPAELCLYDADKQNGLTQGDSTVAQNIAKAMAVASKDVCTVDGDFNGDGVLSKEDIAVLLQAAAGKTTLKTSTITTLNAESQLLKLLGYIQNGSNTVNK